MSTSGPSWSEPGDITDHDDRRRLYTFDLDRLAEQTQGCPNDAFARQVRFGPRPRARSPHTSVGQGMVPAIGSVALGSRQRGAKGRFASGSVNAPGLVGTCGG
jgi:hypothetical protein